MPTNKPFLANFLAAFRAHSSLQHGASSATTSSSSSNAYSNRNNKTSSTIANSTQTASSPRTITTKAGPHQSGATASAVQANGHFQPSRSHAASPYSRSPASPGSPGFPRTGTSSRNRRGSDSSSEGFREALGAEKWYIGGRTATGEERFYKLGMIKRSRSIDRLSIDRMSL